MFNLHKRPIDLIIGGTDNPYLLRWYLIPKNRWFNVYLHKFCRSDDDRALHDHPWLFNISILLKGKYVEQMPANKREWPDDLTRKSKRRYRFIPYIRFGRAPHRVQLYRNNDPYTLTGEAPVWTIFITGPRIRNWGFYCKKGWVFWRDFTKERPGVSEVGKGCGE